MEMLSRYMDSHVDQEERIAEKDLDRARQILNEGLKLYMKNGPSAAFKFCHDGLLEAGLINKILFIFNLRMDSCKIRYVHSMDSNTITGVIQEAHLQPNARLPIYAWVGGNQTDFLSE